MGIKRMIQNDAYCTDVLIQLSAVENATKSLSNHILESHLYSCVSRDLENGNLTLEEAINKYEEGVKLINKLYKKLNTLEGKIKIVSNDIEKDAGDELNGYR